MPTELRQISFRPQEVVVAVRDFYRRRSLPMTSGQVLGISFTGPPDIRATLSIQSDQDMTLVDFNLSSETLAAALVFFCINRSIPLPATATKQLRLNGEEIALVISMTQAPVRTDVAVR